MTIAPRLPKARFLRGIQGRLILILCILIIPMLLIQVYVYHDRFQTHRAKELQANLELARAVAKTFEIFVKETLHQELAIGLALASKDLSPADKDGILNAMKAENRALWELFWVNTEGSVTTATGSHFIGMDISDRPYFKQIVSGKEWVVSDLLLSKTSHLPSITLSRGIRDFRGELLGIFVAGILPERLDAVLGIERSKDAGVSILDSKGMLVYRHPGRDYTWEQRKWLEHYPLIAEALHSKEVVGTIVSRFDDKSRLVGFSPIPLCGWVAAASVGESEAMAALHASLLPQAGAFLLITLVVLGIALLSSRKISASIEKLRAHALALGRGETPISVGFSGTVELDDLGSTFTRMSEEIQSRENERKQAEEAAIAAHRQVQNIIDNTTAIIYAFDLEERFLLANTALAELLNSTPEQMIGKRRHEFMPIDDADWHEANDRQVIETGRALEFEEYSQLKGRSITWLTTKFPLRDVQGRIYAVGGISADVSERKQAEEALRESEERLKLTLQSSAVGTFEIDLTTGVGRWNAVEYELLGLRPGDAPGDPETFFRYVHPQDVVELRARWDEATRIGRFAAEFRVIRADGQERWLAGKGQFAFAETEDAGSAGEKRSPLRFLGVNLDITERKRAEEALRKAHDKLDLRVKERTAELERKNQELQEFAFVASHDLAEPLRKIQTFGDLLKAKSEDRLREEEKDYILRMTGAANRMQELLDALLRYSRIETKGQDFVPVELDHILRTVEVDLEVPIGEIGAQVEIGPLPIINGDPYQWRQVFQNLIANAVKYHRSEVKPVIKIYGLDGTGRILVEDNGIGFDEKYLDKIFQPFQRLHGKNEYPGTGIGLAICKKIIERHGGTITAKSTPGKGSTFIITLPMNGTKTVNRSE